MMLPQIALDDDAPDDDTGRSVAPRPPHPLADQGYANAQYNLGVSYFHGQGVPQDYVREHMWFNLAASRYSATENEKREKVVAVHDTLAKLMTPWPNR
jgi:hypothetical protein